MSGSRFNQSGVVANSATRFTRAPMSDVEFSRMTATPTHLTTFNAGDIVPIYYAEVLPHDTFSIDLDFVIRQNTVLTPTMGQMEVDFYAAWVPNRVVNESWKNVQGENSSGMWNAPEVSLAPLYSTRSGMQPVQIPVGSVADYYGFPTQRPIPAEVLQQCNDLLFRGYLDVYNEHFRDQNYQAPIPFSKLNVYEGFLEPVGVHISLDPSSAGAVSIGNGQVSDGSAPKGALQKAIYGVGSNNNSGVASGAIPPRAAFWKATQPPLKANKLHDYFTSVLPSPQKGPEYVFSLANSAPISFDTDPNLVTKFSNQGGIKLYTDRMTSTSGKLGFIFNPTDSSGNGTLLTTDGLNVASGTTASVTGWNITGNVDLSQVSAISVNDLRFGAAVQQVYETLARGGSRYREIINSFFGLDTENPFYDTSVIIGHLRRNLDLYQTAQTSASPVPPDDPNAKVGTPQGNLAAFGYTANSGHLFTKTFVEHGYVHIFAVVRHRNVYPSFMSRDKFRLNTMDFYCPPLANISEQPVYTIMINPFASESDSVFGYQEAWSEYRYEPDRVSAYMRPGVNGSLDLWNYADEFDSGLLIADGNWMKSNSAEVLDRSLAVTSSVAPQFKGLFRFSVTKERPMPTYSVPGMDII